MAKLTKVEQQKKNNSRYSVYIDDVFAFGISEDVYIRNRKTLTVGNELTKEYIEEVLTAEEIQRTMDSALNLLSFRIRSEQELRTRLRQKGYEDNWIESALEKLRSYNYVDDEAFARTLAKDRQNIKKLGKRGLKAELQQKGISSDIIAEVVDELCNDEKELEQAIELCAKKYRTISGKYPLLKTKQKLYQFLIRKGYSFEIVGKAISTVFAS